MTKKVTKETFESLLRTVKYSEPTTQNLLNIEEKGFYDILLASAKKYEFEFADDKMLELSKEIIRFCWRI